MLGSARFLGVFPGAGAEIPNSVTAFLVSELGLQEGPPSLKGYLALELYDMAKLVFEDNCRSINGTKPCSSGFPVTILRPRWPRSTRSPGRVTPSLMRSF